MYATASYAAQQDDCSSWNDWMGDSHNQADISFQALANTQRREFTPFVPYAALKGKSFA